MSPSPYSGGSPDVFTHRVIPRRPAAQRGVAAPGHRRREQPVGVDAARRAIGRDQWDDCQMTGVRG
jgi:hypothetical protein